MILRLLVVSTLFFSSITHAKEFGVDGAVFPVTEESAKTTFMNELEKAERDGRIAEGNKEFERKVRQRIARPKVITELGKAEVYRTYLVDMTKPLEKDVFYEGKLRHAKGTLINPLDHRVITRHLVVINGDRDVEVKFAVDYAKQHPTTKIILFQGPVQQLYERYGVNFYFIQTPKIPESFYLTVTPSVIYQDGNRMRVEEIPL